MVFNLIKFISTEPEVNMWYPMILLDFVVLLIRVDYSVTILQCHEYLTLIKGQRSVPLKIESWKFPWSSTFKNIPEVKSEGEKSERSHSYPTVVNAVCVTWRTRRFIAKYRQVRRENIVDYAFNHERRAGGCEPCSDRACHPTPSMLSRIQ